LEFKVDIYNDVYDFTLFNFLKHVLTLILFTPSNAPTLNPNISFKKIILNEMERILF
jgi:hypothetical protein